MSFFCACVHVCFCEHPCLTCLSVILRHRWGSSQPVSFIIPTNYSKSSFQSSCSTRSSLYLPPALHPATYPSIHPSHLCSLYLFHSPIWVYQSLLYSSFLPLPSWDWCLWWRELNQQLSLSNNVSCVIRLHSMIRAFWINNLTIIGHIFSTRHMYGLWSV